MDWKTPGGFRSAEAFRARWQSIAPELDLDAELPSDGGAFARPLELANGRRIGNRWAVQPMEGWDGTSDGLPSELTRRRWHRFGQSGAKLIWGGEAFAVNAEGRANPHQLHLDPNSPVEAGLASLREVLLEGHRESSDTTDDLCIGLQLTHSGRWARPEGKAAPRIVHRHPILDDRVGAGEEALLSDGELETIAALYPEAARLAQRAGFDFVDLKCCHGYLLHETLAAHTRPGPYGGGFENRTRLFRRILAAIRAEAPGLEVGVRVSLADLIPYAAGADGRGCPHAWDADRSYRYGFGVDVDDPARMDLAEGFAFLELLRDEGIRLVNLSLGSPYYNPHLQRPAAYPPSDGYTPPEDPLHQVAAHLRVVRAVRERFPEFVLVGSGYSYLQEWLPAVGHHELRAGQVDFVGLGRMILSYPALPRDVLAGRKLDRKAICRTFSDCTTGPRHGLPSGCYPLDAAYRSLPEAATLKKIKEGLR